MDNLTQQLLLARYWRLDNISDHLYNSRDYIREQLNNADAFQSQSLRHAMRILKASISAMEAEMEFIHARLGLDAVAGVPKPPADMPVFDYFRIDLWQ